MQSESCRESITVLSEDLLEKDVVRKVTIRLIPFLFICFAISILDRIKYWLCCIANERGFKIF